MKETWQPEENEIIRISSRCFDNQPGLEAQCDPTHGAVVCSLPVEKLNFTNEQKTLLLKIVGAHYQVDEGHIKFEVKHFPFKEQNEKRAMEIIRNLLDYVKTDGNDRFTDVPLVLPKSRRRMNLQFPKEWLKQ